MGIAEATERHRITRLVIEENRLKREAEQLRAYNSPEEIAKREEISQQVDALIEGRLKMFPSTKQVESVIEWAFHRHPEKLAQHKNGNEKIAGWMIGRVRSVLPGVGHKQVRRILSNYETEATI